MKEGTINIWPAIVSENLPRANGIFELVLTCPFVHEFGLGHFLCLEPLDPESVMARPFSVYSKNLIKGTVSILYRVVGKNTSLLSKLVTGQEIKAWGPLGRATETASLLAYQKVYIVGGGIGLAALCQWQNELFNLRIGHEIFYGNKIQDETVRFLSLLGNGQISFATEDGSLGFHGLVTDLFAQQMVVAEKSLVLTCGPQKMMQSVAKICRQKNVVCWVSLESTMACGLGVCLGCSVKMKSGQKRICHDGPFFPAEEVIWHELC